MADVSATLVKELRELTGAGMMDCKRALEETGGDLDEARRSSCARRAWRPPTKRAGRETTEGIVLARCRGWDGYDRRRRLRDGAGLEERRLPRVRRPRARRSCTRRPDAVAQLEEEQVALVAKLGENVAVRGSERFVAGGRRDGERLRAPTREQDRRPRPYARRLRSSRECVAMHIAFANPQYLARSEVPPKRRSRRSGPCTRSSRTCRASRTRSVRRSSKACLQKRFFAESVLADQAWIHDDSLTVAKALAEHGAEVREFVRFALAG